MKGITHVVLSFADPAYLLNGTTEPHFPFRNISDFRGQFDAGTKFGAAIGGWEKSPGFHNVTDQNMQEFIKNTQTLVGGHGLDFIDIDWEYPGGGGIDYKTENPDQKNRELQLFPELLKGLKAMLGDKELSVAVAGKLEDIDIYNSEYKKDVWDAVDFVNVMTYDLMNRRDTTTTHSSSVTAAKASILKYINELGLPAEKINLGFPLYAKFFELAPGSNCTGPLDCPIMPAEAANGSDTHTSDYVSFETYNLANQPITEIGLGQCGPLSPNTRCAGSTCCSRFGNCGTDHEYCGPMCLTKYGSCESGPDMVASFQKATAHGIYDEAEGAMWYIDTIGNRKFFWSWDSVQIIQRKITEIVQEEQLGGVMGWGVGHNSDGSLTKAITAASR